MRTYEQFEAEVFSAIKQKKKKKQIQKKATVSFCICLCICVCISVFAYPLLNKKGISSDGTNITNDYERPNESDASDSGNAKDDYIEDDEAVKGDLNGFIENSQGTYIKDKQQIKLLYGTLSKKNDYQDFIYCRYSIHSDEIYISFYLQDKTRIEFYIKSNQVSTENETFFISDDCLKIINQILNK